MRGFYLFTATLVACAFCSGPLWGQATVNESLETKTLYVDVAKGSDTNPGTSALPLKSMGAAVTLAMANKVANLGTKVIVNPGLYRESISLIGEAGLSSLPITFQAATTGTVQMSGAVQYTGWTPSHANSKIYTAAWPNQWGFCSAYINNAPFEPDIVLRREMVIVNGTPMTQVLALSSMKYPGMFFVDETAGLIYLWPPTGTNLTTADVEVPTHPTLLTIQGPMGLPISDIVVRGITFEYANPCHADPAVNVSGMATNILFDKDTFIWNNGRGIGFTDVANTTLMNSTLNHNGSTGFQGYQLVNALWKNNTASYNNWRGALGAYYEWNSAAALIFSDHSDTISGLTANYNQTHTIHWDTDVQNATADSVFSSQNIFGPLFEKSEGPLTVTNSHFCSSQTVASGYGGFILRNATKVSMTGSTLYNNNVAQILVTGIAGGITDTDWQTGKTYRLVTENVTLQNNVIEAVGSTQDTIKDGFLGGSDWTSFVTTLKANNNTYWNASDKSPFTVPVPVLGTAVDFAQWQLDTSQDVQSKFVAPATNPAVACAVTADAPDYWLLVDSGLETTNKSGVAVYSLRTIALGGMTGTVMLSADGISAIPNASISFKPATLSTSGTSVLTFTAGAKTPKGTYNFPVLANTGNVTRTVYLQVTVK